MGVDMKKYFSETRFSGPYVSHAYQILGSTSNNPSIDDPIYMVVGKLHDSSYNKFSSSFSVDGITSMKINSLRIESNINVGQKRFDFYDRLDRRLNKLSSAIANRCFPELHSKFILS